jgi:pSer/pThr/pTyr-binding forkhead associated (FHA) protein
MATCSDCRTDYLTGVLSCPECGLFVWGDTIVLNSDKEVTDISGIVAFIIPKSDRRWVLALDNEVNIGRADPDKDLWPEVDLTSESDALNGVSRQHALLRHSDHGPVLVDLDSMNGTIINDFPLSPFQPYLLQNGDRVQFGDLLVKVYLKN